MCSRPLLIPLCLVCLSLTLIDCVTANVPEWWSDYDVGPNAGEQDSSITIEENYQPALLGQAKYMAYQAWQAMEAREKGSAGEAVTNLVKGFSTAEEDNYQILLLGQLKAIALPFYQKFQERGYYVSEFGIEIISEDYPFPWIDPGTEGYDVEMNYQPANIGQLKYLFSFGLENWGLKPELFLDLPADENPATPEIETNDLSIVLSGTIESTNFGSLSVNGDILDSVEESGGFSFEYPLSLEGENVLNLFYQDQSGNSAEESVTIYRVTQAPELQLDYPSSDATYTRYPTNNFVGTVGESASALTINGGTVTILEGGSFTDEVTLSEGENLFTVEVSDILGNSRKIDRKITLDTSSPQFIESSLVDGQLVNSSEVSFSGILSEAGTMIVNGQMVELTDDYSFEQLVPLVEGVNTITVLLRDALGNLVSKTIEVVLDVTAPTITILQPSSETATSADTTILSGVVDDEGAILTLNGLQITLSEGVFTEEIQLAEGLNELFLIATDEAGNTSQKIFNIVRDSVAPAFLSLNPSENDTTASPNLTIGGLLDDARASVSITKDGELLPVVVNQGLFESYVTLSEGENSFMVRATDLAVNKASESFTITLDSQTIAPVIHGLPSFINSDRLNLIEGNAEPSATVELSGGLMTVQAECDENGAFSFSSYLLESNQTNNLLLRSVDPYGNKAETAVQVVSDTIVPTIVVDKPLEGEAIKGLQVPVIGRIEDSNPGNTISINGESVPLTSSGEFSTLMSFSDGQQTLTLHVTDLAGNAAKPVERTFSVSEVTEDVTAPTIQVISPKQDTIISNTTTTLELFLADESGISSLIIDGVEQDLSSLSDGFIRLPVTIDADGEIEFEVTDYAVPANTTILTHRVVLDATVPSVPTLRLLSPSSPTNDDTVSAYLSIDPNTTYRMSGPLLPMTDQVSGSNGQVTAILPLAENQSNVFSVVAVGQNGLESSLSFTVVQDSEAPFVVDSIPVNQSKAALLSVTPQLTFSERIAEDSLEGIQLLQEGDPVAFTYSYLSETNQLTLIPDGSFSEASEIRIVLPEQLQDVAGNLIAGRRKIVFETVDLTAPDSPSNLHVDRYYTNQSQTTVSGTAEPESLVSIEGGAALATGFADLEGNFSVTVTLIEGSSNSLTITAADSSENVSEPATLVIEHNESPFLLNQYEPFNENAAIDTEVTLLFNRTVDENTISAIALVGDGLGVISTTVATGVSSDTVTIVPTEMLAYGTGYRVVVPTSVSDLFGNTFTSGSEITFTTVAEDTPAAPLIHESNPTDLTNKNRITLSGYSTPGTIVTISGGSSLVTYPDDGVVDNTGEFTLEVPLQLDQENHIILTAAYPDGNPSIDSEAIVIVQDSTAPEVLSVSPTGNSVAVTTIISVEFSEPVSAQGFSSSPASVQLLDGQNRSVRGNWFPSENQKVWAFYPAQNLDAATQYAILVNTSLKDLAGNGFADSESYGFVTSETTTTEAQIPDAPILNPQSFDTTQQPTVTYHGTAQPNSTLYVLGGKQVVTAEVDSNGNFTVNVPLLKDSENQLAAYVEDEDGNIGVVTTVSITHTSRETGIRILSPEIGKEYNNRSVMITGILDNVDQFDQVKIETNANGVFESDEAVVFGQFFARQFVRQSYQCILMTGLSSVAQLPSSGSRTLTIGDVSGVLHFRFIDKDGVSTDYSESDYPDAIDAFTELKGQLEDLWDQAEIESEFHAEIEGRVAAITKHSITEGTQEVEVVGILKSGETVKEQVTFELFIQPVTLDTRPPVVSILYPEDGEVIKEEIVETMLVVEEGVRLESVYIDGVSAHNQVGNFSFIYYKPTIQGENQFKVVARDYSRNIGTASRTVYFDSIGVETPSVDAIPSELPEKVIPVVSGRVITLSGQGEVGSIIEVFNGMTGVQAVVDENGNYSILVPLNPNTQNNLIVVAKDQAGNYSQAQEISVVHDDVAPYPMGSNPVNQQTGVELDVSIKIEFSEALDPTTVDATSVKLSRINQSINEGEKTAISDYNVVLSADGKSITIDPDYKLFRSEKIVVDLLSEIRDINNHRMESPYVLSFQTALYETTLSGVVVDSEIEPLRNVRVGILGTNIEKRTSSFGTFVLDEVPFGDQVLYIDARPDPITEISPQGDDRVFNYLEFPIYIEENSDNSLGRPIFMVDTDFSTETAVQHVSEEETLTFQSDRNDLQGFEIIYPEGAARFADGTDRGNITVTRIPADRIPDRLPSGSIPHFMVEIGPDALRFHSPVSVRFPNVYDLQPGDEVIVFHFKHGLADYKEVARMTLDESLDILATDAISESGFVGYVPVGETSDYTRAYLEGRVVDGNGSGLAGVAVNAVAASTSVLTDSSGFYRIPLPEVRLLWVQTFATISTRQSLDDSETPDLIYPSELVELAISGTTQVPDIVIDSFTLEGSIRYFNSVGEKLGLTGYATNAEGFVTGIDAADAKRVDIFVYRRIGDSGGSFQYDSVPYMKATCDLGNLIDPQYDASYSMTFLGSLEDSVTMTTAPKPGDVVKVVAFDKNTGFYAEQDVTIQSPAQGANAMLVNLDLYPPMLELDMNRVFYIDGVRRRANIPHRGIVFTDDEFVEFKTNWQTVKVIPLAREELSLPTRLRVESIDYHVDYNFRMQGGNHFQVLEIREALYLDRLDVLQRETDVGREVVSVSRDGSFLEQTLIPISVDTSSYGSSASLESSEQTTSSPVQEVIMHVLDIAFETLEDDSLLIRGRTLPGASLDVSGHSFTADSSGYFGNQVGLTMSEGGVNVGLSDSVITRVGASYTPVILSLSPDRGSQGAMVAIEGEHFSPITGDNKVSFNGAVAEVVSASESLLKVIVPSAASSGNVTVTVAGKVSNGAYFEFISYGINNGSFETADFHGFSLQGSGTVVDSLSKTEPTDRQYMAFLDTAFDARDGESSLQSDPFVVGDLGSTPMFIFDYYLMGTAVFVPINHLLDIYVINEAGEIIHVDGVLPDIEAFNSFRLTGYNRGSGFRTAAVNLASAGVVAGDTIQMRFVLKGRGSLLNFIPGSRSDDMNPLDSTKRAGTGMLLDNLRLSSGFAQPDPLDLSLLGNSTTETIGEETFVVISSSQLLPEGSRVFVSSLQSGNTLSFDVDANGIFEIRLPRETFLPLKNPFSSTDSGRIGYWVLWYRTPDTSESNEPSNSYSSAPVTYELEAE